MKVLWAVICQSCAVDRETNSVSLFNLLEQIHVPEPPTEEEENIYLPTSPISFFLVASFSRTDLNVGERNRGRIRIEFPNAIEPDLLPDFEIDLKDAHRNRFRGQFPSMPVKGEGEYRFIIEVDESGEWRQLFEIPLMVSYQEQ